MIRSRTCVGRFPPAAVLLAGALVAWSARSDSAQAQSPRSAQTARDSSAAGQAISPPSQPRNERRIESADASQSIERRGIGSVWSTVASLAVVLGLVALAALFWKRGPHARLALPTEALDVLGRRMLDPKGAVYLVRVGGRLLLIGSNAAGMNTLAEITDPVEVDSLAGLCRRDRQESAGQVESGFLALFSRSRWANDRWQSTADGSPEEERTTGSPALRTAVPQREATRA